MALPAAAMLTRSGRIAMAWGTCSVRDLAQGLPAYRQVRVAQAGLLCRQGVPRSGLPSRDIRRDGGKIVEPSVKLSPSATKESISIVTYPPTPPTHCAP